MSYLEKCTKFLIIHKQRNIIFLRLEYKFPLFLDLRYRRIRTRDAGSGAHLVFDLLVKETAGYEELDPGLGHVVEYEEDGDQEFQDSIQEVKHLSWRTRSGGAWLGLLPATYWRGSLRLLARRKSQGPPLECGATLRTYCCCCIK